MDLNTKISKYFKLKEALFLPSWGVYHTPTEQELFNIITFAKQLDLVREFIGLTVNVNVWIRPIKVNTKDAIIPIFSKDSIIRQKQEIALKNLNYNMFIGSIATKSAHILGRAVDFTFKGFTTPDKCAVMRYKLIPKLEEWNLRMENIVGNWIHLDNMPVINKRFFKP